MKTATREDARAAVIKAAHTAVEKWGRLMEGLNTPIPVAFVVAMRALQAAARDLEGWEPPASP